MSKTKSVHKLLMVMLVIISVLAVNSFSLAEVKEVRIAKQYGLPYLPLIIAEENKLIEKQAKAAGLGDIKVTWATLGNGASANDALLSGSVDFISGGVAPLITIWAKSNGSVKALAALDTTPLYLNTINPAVKSVRDFTDKDRIALPTVKVSIQAVLLQMAVAKEFGLENYAKLDNFTISMKHPDGLIALLSGKTEITAHFTSPPYSFQELEKPNVRKIIDSYDLLGGAHTMNVISTSTKFYNANPKTAAVVLEALERAVNFIKQNKQASAEIYVKAANSNESINDILAQLNNPQIGYNTAPLKITKFSDFMYSIGSIDIKPKDWKDLFFPNIHQKG
jgi:NitT/TauT family transport system substrate-binding protein